MSMQTANAAGCGNFIVQIAGDGNHVAPELPHLKLTRPYGLARRIQRDLDTGRPREIDIIRAFTRSIDMVGRETELADLRAWLRKEPAISLRVLTGNAGYGKTRLALELIEEMAPQGWCAGFLTRAELKRFRGQHNLADWGWNAPTLAVVDYAATSVRDLHAWLKELANNPVWENGEVRNERPLRLLLLERQAVRGCGWWAEVFGVGDDAAVLEKLADPAEPVALMPLDDGNQRRAILTKTLACLGSTVTLPAPGDDTDFDRRLTELTWGGVPLLLMIAAITAERVGFGQVLAMGSEELAFSIAETELARIRKVVESRGVPKNLAPLVDHVAAVVTLRQGLTADAMREMIAQESEKLGYNLPSGSAAVRDAFAVALPDVPGGIAAIEPDMIGEALLLRVWPETNTLALPAIARAHAADPDAVAKTVIRTCQDYVIRGHRYPLSWLEKIRADSVDLNTLVELSNAMPMDTLELREIAAALATTVVDTIKSRGDDLKDLDQLAILAASLNNLSNRFSALGRREEALASIKEAVAIQRDLAATRPDAFRPDLATSLNNLSNCFSELGRREEALAAIEEAVAIQRDLAATRPDLAGSLSNLSNRFSALGRREEALASNEEAVAIQRDLAAARPDAFRPDLARSLNNLSTHFSAHGRREEALAAIEEAVAILRDLAAARPDAFRPNLAGFLSNLSNCFSALGRREEAFASIEEAVAIQRDLAAARPASFCPDLAASLNNLSAHFSALGRREEALASIEEAVAIRRDLAAVRPDAFRPDFAGFLNNLSNRFAELGRREEALASIEEAVAIQRDLAAARPDTFRPDLAGSLNNLSTHFSTHGRREEALASIEEAVAIQRDSAAARPDAFRPNLAGFLSNLSNCFSAHGRREEALAANEEAVAIQRDLAAARPDAFRPDLATSLNNLSNHFSALGRREEALAAIEEAVAIQRDLAAAQPDAFRPDFAGFLNNLSNRFAELGRREEALASIEEAAAVLREPFLAQPIAFRQQMTQTRLRQ